MRRGSYCISRFFSQLSSLCHAHIVAWFVLPCSASFSICWSISASSWELKCSSFSSSDADIITIKVCQYFDVTETCNILKWKLFGRRTGSCVLTNDKKWQSKTCRTARVMCSFSVSFLRLAKKLEPFTNLNLCTASSGFVNDKFPVNAPDGIY